jgi:hypothetical protein
MANPVVHFEIGCRNSPELQKFYGRLFGWKIESQGPAAMISTGSTEGIQGHFMSLGHEPNNYVTFYVQVDNLQAYLDQAAKLGGKTCVPPQEVPGMGHFAWLSDPEGTIVGLWKPMI